MDLKELCTLPGSAEERKWLLERLETLSVKESLLLTAAQMQQPAGDLTEVIGLICSLPDYTLVTPAGSYEELGKRYLERETRVPWGLHDQADLNKLGRWYEDTHPGLFLGNGYVAYPKEPLSLDHTVAVLSQPEDTDWSIKLKLASPTVPEGVWLRLPDYDEMNDEPGEIRLALDALKVKTVQECRLLEARCILPNIIGLKEQYSDLAELIYDGQNLGFILNEQKPEQEKKFLTVLEYEGCQRLKDAVNISQNLDCYDFVMEEDLEGVALEQLKKAGVMEAVIQEGCFDLKRYGAAVLTEKGFTIMENGNGIFRNEKPFELEYLDASPGMAMTM